MKDLSEHGRLIKNFSLSIRFSIGYCKSCKDFAFTLPNSLCLSGGRYCIVNSEFRTNALVKETLRQICIRNNYGNSAIASYLYNMKLEVEPLYYKGLFNERDLEIISSSVMSKLGIDYKHVTQCYNDSFIPSSKDFTIDASLDDNELLKKEQKAFFAVTKYDIFPLIIVNKLYYDRNINIREFIQFGCENKMFDCRGFRLFKWIFFFAAVSISLVMLVVVILFCRKAMKRKEEKELNLKVSEVIKQYLNVEKK